MKDKYKKYGYMFIAPFFITVAVFYLFPILYTFAVSFTDTSGIAGEAVFIGARNYSKLLQDRVFWNAVKNTVVMWGISFMMQVTFALLIAVLITSVKLKLRGGNIFKAVFYLPNLITTVSMAVLFHSFLGINGVFNQFLIRTGMIEEPIAFMRNGMFMQFTVAYILWWMWFGFHTIIIVTGILGIPDSLQEAAIMDGAGEGQMFIFITFPLLKPILIYTLITSLIGGLQVFDIVSLLTDGLGSPNYAINTIVLYLYNTGFRYYNHGYASAIGVALFLMTGICCMVGMKFMNKGKE